MIEETQFTETDLEALRKAKTALEYPSLLARVTELIGTPIEKGIDCLPRGWKKKITTITQAVLMKSLDAALLTMHKSKPGKHETLHKIAVGSTGAIAGTFGLASLAIELPISTGIILRSIAEIAHSEGHDLAQLATRLSCLEVFALGGPSKQDDAVNTGYWSVRVALAKALPEMLENLTARGLGEAAAGQLTKFITLIAARFSIVVAEEAAARAIPAVVGAISAASLNVAFMHFYQELAKGHFAIKRLEKQYGTEAVKRKYDEVEV